MRLLFSVFSSCASISLLAQSPIFIHLLDVAYLSSAFVSSVDLNSLTINNILSSPLDQKRQTTIGITDHPLRCLAKNDENHRSDSHHLRETKKKVQKYERFLFSFYLTMLCINAGRYQICSRIVLFIILQSNGNS